MDARFIYVIDDDEGIRGALQDVLEGEGYRVETAANGREALEALGAMRELPGLILLDLTMPGMNGWEFCAVRRVEPRLASVPVVLFTAGGVAAPGPDELGAQGMLRKPIELDDLLRAVDRHARPSQHAMPTARTG